MNTRTTIPEEGMRIAGVVLTGGKSSRMGQDKAGLLYEGRSLQDRAEEALRAASVATVCVSGPGGIADDVPGCGPLAGIAATMKALRGRFTHALYVPVDMPGMTAEPLQRLIAAPADWDGVRIGGFVLPFRLRLAACWIEVADSMLRTDGPRSLRAFQRHLAVRELMPDPVRDAAFFINVNTPEEWRAFTKEPS